MVSLEEVAQVAGVSPATVSRVLSGASYPVREETRQKVIAAAGELGFRPNMLARGLATSRTSIVAVVVHDISDPYFGEIVRGVEEGAAERDYQVLISSSGRDPDHELDVLALLLAYNVDGVIFAAGSLDDREYESAVGRLISSFKEQERAVVHLAPHVGGGSRVTVDNASAAREMTAHLVALGHRRIALLAGPAALSTARERTLGYRRGLEDAGLSYDPDLVVETDFTSDGGRRAAGALLDTDAEVTAIFATNDLTAFGALSELHERGLAVPKDVSVVGFDDIQAAKYVWPPLTTVAVPLRELGRRSFTNAMHILDGEEPDDVELPTRIVVRDSAGPRHRDAAAEGPT